MTTDKKTITLCLLSDNLMAAITEYYHHREQSIRANMPWNKEADIQIIVSIAKSEGWEVQKEAGTFWFIQTAGVLPNRVIKINEQNYKKGGVSNIPADHKSSLGIFSSFIGVLNRKKE